MAEAIAKNIPGKRWTRIIPPCILVGEFTIQVQHL